MRINTPDSNVSLGQALLAGVTGRGPHSGCQGRAVYFLSLGPGVASQVTFICGKPVGLGWMSTASRQWHEVGPTLDISDVT